MSDKIFAEGSHACHHFQDLLSDDRAMMDPFFAAKKKQMADFKGMRIILFVNNDLLMYHEVLTYQNDEEDSRGVYTSVCL